MDHKNQESYLIVNLMNESVVNSFFSDISNEKFKKLNPPSQEYIKELENFIVSNWDTIASGVYSAYLKFGAGLLLIDADGTSQNDIRFCDANFIEDLLIGYKIRYIKMTSLINCHRLGLLNDEVMNVVVNYCPEEEICIALFFGSKKQTPGAFLVRCLALKKKGVQELRKPVDIWRSNINRNN